MARLYGRAPRGERCQAAVPHGHWKTTTFTAGLRIGGIAAPWLIDGPMDGDAFRAYVTKVLVPELAPGDVVVMDNLPAHRVSGVREAIEAAGATLLYLPPYSPDLNPIEMAFAKLKACVPSPQEQSRTSGKRSRMLSISSCQMNAQTTSPPQDITHSDRKML